MIVEHNNMRYEDHHELCSCEIISGQHGKNFAFVQCFDISTQELKRYWGSWDLENPESSMLSILDRGGKWPKLYKQMQDFHNDALKENN